MNSKSKNSGLADSPFFSEQFLDSESTKQIPESESRKSTEEGSDTTASILTDEPHDTIPGMNHDAVTPRYHGTTIERVRLAVKEVGKEAATHRFTKSEKEAIAAIVYVVKRQGIRTSENEITRIAVNYVIEDYQTKGDESLLAKSLEALNG